MKLFVRAALIAAFAATPAFAQDAGAPDVDPAALEGDMLSLARASAWCRATKARTTR
ncbi:MAG: hypothetical protein WDN24_21625 [Sphingomonas sp.]